MMQNSASATAEKSSSQIITIDEGQIQQHRGEMVLSTVDETLNAMLDAEARITSAVPNAMSGPKPGPISEPATSNANVCRQ